MERGRRVLIGGNGKGETGEGGALPPATGQGVGSAVSSLVGGGSPEALQSLWMSMSTSKHDCTGQFESPMQHNEFNC